MSNANNQTVRTSDKAAALFTDKAGNVNSEIVLLPSCQFVKELFPQKLKVVVFNLFVALNQLGKGHEHLISVENVFVFFLTQLNLQDC